MEIEKNIKKHETAYEAALENLKTLQVLFLTIAIISLIVAFCFMYFYLRYGFDKANLTEGGKWCAVGVVFIIPACLMPSARLLVEVANIYIKNHENK